MAVGGVFTLGLCLYTGYLIPFPSMVGALRWISYINPLRYGFEALISSEFHNLLGECSTLVPAGPGYANISSANQACTVVGSVPGSSTVLGDSYIELSFGFSHGNLWRNFGILVAFWLGFVAWFMYATERAGNQSAGALPLLFRAGVEIPPEHNDLSHNDEERANVEMSVYQEHRMDQTKVIEDAVPGRDTRDVFSWQHLNYDVGHGELKKRLLNDISGFVVPGKLTALMGESGAGKTTLLNVLAQRVTMGIVSGDRLVNGSPLPRDFARQTGYCQQMDIHLESTTVREALMFSALLRQPASVSIEEKRTYVEEVIKMCEMESYADAIVGTPEHGLGVERRKRLTIGVELAAKPQLLVFLDEPTSGLDSQSAWTIVKFLKTLADRGQAILCTIHQPSSELFQQFDRLLLLKKGGRTCYFGDIGYNADTLIQYFEHYGARQCAPDENPAEYMLDVIGAGATAAKSNVDWENVWNASEERVAFERELAILHEKKHQTSATPDVEQPEFAASGWTQFTALYARGLKNYARNPTYLLSKFMLNFAAGLFIGFTFYKAGYSLQGLQNQLFAVFIPSTLMSTALSNQLQIPFLNFRNIWEEREKASKMYHWVPMTTVSILLELPLNILGATFFFVCWYWSVGFLNESERVGFAVFYIHLYFHFYRRADTVSSGSL
jgi:ATP-binding cassette subfamily G (WHITE) protein 2 (SNQ2)